MRFPGSLGTRSRTRRILRDAVIGALSASLVAPGGLAQVQSYHEKAAVSLIRVDLTVTDSDGRPVQDLRRGEVHLRVDGNPVAVESLDPIETLSQGENGPSLVPIPEAAARSPSPSPEEPSLWLAILIDETSIGSYSKTIIRDSLEKFLQQPLPPGVRLTVERFDGRLHVECPWTPDIKLARSAAATVFQRSFLRVLPSPAEIGDPAGFAPSEVGYFSARSLDGVYQALLLFPDRVAGRRGLVWVTDGTPLLSARSMQGGATVAAEERRAAVPGAPRWAAKGRDPIGPASLATPDKTYETWSKTYREWSDNVRKVAEKAIQREIAISPVNAQPIDSSLSLGETTEKKVRRASADILAFTVRADVVHEMTGIGTATGGEAILVGGNLDRDLRGAVAARTTGYILTFRDPSPEDPRSHDLRISVERPGVRLRYRRGFRSLDPATNLADRVVSNLYVPSPANPLDVRVRTTVLERTKERVSMGVTVRFPALPEAGGLDRASRAVRIAGACLDSSGRVSKPFGMVRTTISREKGMLEHSFSIAVRPGRHTWSLGVRDEASGITSFLRFETEL